MIARLEVTRGTLTEYPIAEKVRGGWQNGVTFYPDVEVTKVTPLQVLPAELIDGDLIAWHVEQIEALRPFARSSTHIKAAIMHAATIRALRSHAEPKGGES